MIEMFFSTRIPAREILHRLLLSRGISAEFTRGEHGKPALAHGGPEFNLTHTDGLAIVALSPAGRPAGVDAERVKRQPARIAARCFSPLEQSLIRSPADFYRLWTMKESVIKFHGGSLARDLRGTVILPPEDALYRGALSPARVLSSFIRAGGETYAFSVAAECPDFILTEYR